MNGYPYSKISWFPKPGFPTPSPSFSTPHLPNPVMDTLHPFSLDLPFLSTLHLSQIPLHYISMDSSQRRLLTPWDFVGTFLSSSCTWQKRTIHTAIDPTLVDCKHCQYHSALFHQASQSTVSSDILHITSRSCTFNSFFIPKKIINPSRQERVGNMNELTSSTNTSTHKGTVVWQRSNF